MKSLIRFTVQSNKQITTEFGQFYILKIGVKYIHAELLGSIKNFNVQLVKNSVIAEVKVGETIYLRVFDESIQNSYGTKLKFKPIELLTNQVDIENYILAERKRVADIYIKAAQENLANGWYSGEAIEKALIFSASHVDFKPLNHQLRFDRLKNTLQKCCEYEWKQTPQFVTLSRSALQMYNEEKNIGDLDLKIFERSVKIIQSNLDKAEKNAEHRNQEHLTQLKALLRK